MIFSEIKNGGAASGRCEVRLGEGGQGPAVPLPPQARSPNPLRGIMNSSEALRFTHLPLEREGWRGVEIIPLAPNLVRKGA